MRNPLQHKLVTEIDVPNGLGPRFDRLLTYFGPQSTLLYRWSEVFNTHTSNAPGGSCTTPREWCIAIASRPNTGETGIKVRCRMTRNRTYTVVTMP